jgi:hypothetical protein
MLVAHRGKCRLMSHSEGGAASCMHALQFLFPRRCARRARLGRCQGRLKPLGSSVPAAAFYSQASQLSGLGGGFNAQISELLGKTSRGFTHFGGIRLRRPKLVSESRDRRARHGCRCRHRLCESA